MVAILKHSVLKPHGTGIIVDPDMPHDVQFDMLQCCHCQVVWKVQPGSGRLRGFCQKCNQVTCGSPECGECLPFEERLTLYEAGKIATL